MHYGSTYNDVTWVMSPYANPGDASNVWFVSGDGLAGNDCAASPRSAFPTIYLKSNILIESGTGTGSDPYILKLGN